MGHTRRGLRIVLSVIGAIVASAVMSPRLLAGEISFPPPVYHPTETKTTRSCTASDLTGVVQVFLSNATYVEAIVGQIEVTNASSNPCTLDGVPAVGVFDATGAPLPMTEQSASSASSGTSLAVTLPPGWRTRAGLNWHNLCAPPVPPGPYTMRVMLPDDGSLSVPFSTVPPFSAPEALLAVPFAWPPCSMSASPHSVIDVGAFGVPFGAQPPPAAPDNRSFAQTGFRIDNDTVWDYFNRRGGVTTFGFPVSRTFLFQGFTVQFFQRRIVQIGPDGNARLLNVLDPGLLPYISFNYATFPGFDRALVASAPPATDTAATLAWVRAHAPDTFAGAPVNFYRTFIDTVPAATALPNGGDSNVLPGFDLEMWGIPTSPPLVDPRNHLFVYLRFQRGMMMYDASCRCTRGALLADYLKSILTGDNLPADLAGEAQNSPFLHQYSREGPNWVRDPSLLPNTNLVNAFDPG